MKGEGKTLPRMVMCYGRTLKLPFKNYKMINITVKETSPKITHTQSRYNQGVMSQVAIQVSIRWHNTIR